MFNDLTALGYGLVVFAIIIGVGTVVLVNFGNSVATCATAYTWNTTQQKCVNASNGDPTATSSQAYSNTNYLGTQLGSSGLAGWTPAIIALAIGLLFLGSFFIKNSKKGRY